LNKFLIGCDPEFAGLDATGNTLRFAAGIPHETDRELGSDHGGYVAELHPTPHHGTYMLVKKLQRIIQSLPAFQVAKLRAGAFIPGRPISLGGHIHLDIPHVGEERRLRADALDLVTQNLEALDILPKRESEQRRANGDYGYLGDIRTDKGRTEYRTMASWLDRPEVAMLCLTAAKLAAFDPINTCNDLKTPAAASFLILKHWFERYRAHDCNAKRVVDKLFQKPQRELQSTPGEDFRDKWRQLAF